MPSPITLAAGYPASTIRKSSFAGSVSEGVAALFQDIDLLLVPAQSIPSPTTAQLANLGDNAEMLNALVRYTMLFDMSGNPTITLPCGFTAAGTPVAFQFVGRLEEEMLVRAGHAYQGPPPSRRTRTFAGSDLTPL